MLFAGVQRRGDRARTNIKCTGNITKKEKTVIMRESVAIFLAGATLFVLVQLLYGYTWPLYIYLPVLGWFIYSGQKRRKAQMALFEEEGFTVSDSYAFDGTDIAIDTQTRRLAVNDHGNMRILSGGDIVKCKAGKSSRTVRPDLMDKDRKVREIVYYLDVWTRDLDNPNFRLHFHHSADLEQWRARINALMEDD